MQDELTEQIAAIVAPELERAEQRRLIALKPANDHAWDCLQRGIAQFHLFTKEGNEIAKQLFERAIELDPNYSQAYGWLTYSLMRDYWLGYTDRREETKDRFIFAGRRAVSLDDTNPFAHSMLALAYMWSGDLEHSITESQAALALNPADHTAYAHIGHALAMKGDPKEGIRNTEKALSLNPRDPRSHVFFIHLALAHLMDGQFEDAADWANKAVQRNVEFAEGHFVLAVSLGHQGRAEEARRALEVCQRLDPDFVPKWPNSRPYLDPVQIDHCLQGLRKAGWEG